MRFLLQAKGLESSLSYIQEPFPLLPAPFSALSPASFLLLGVGGFWFISSPPCPPRSHTHTHNTIYAFLPFACVQGPQDPLGQQLGASERLRKILITLEQPQLDSILSDAF